jgi:ankyrin repeat protein
VAIQRELVAGVDIESRDASGRTALLWSAIKGRATTRRNCSFQSMALTRKPRLKMAIHPSFMVSREPSLDPKNHSGSAYLDVLQGL